jgi:hypothetical protein
MKFTPPILVKSGPNSEDSLEFTLDGKKVTITFNWREYRDNNWFFDLILSHPDLIYTIEHVFNDEENVTKLLDILSQTSSITLMPSEVIKSLSEQINTIIKPYYDNGAPYSSEDECINDEG